MCSSLFINANETSLYVHIRTLLIFDENDKIFSFSAFCAFYFILYYNIIRIWECGYFADGEKMIFNAALAHVNELFIKSFSFLLTSYASTCLPSILSEAHKRLSSGDRFRPFDAKHTRVWLEKQQNINIQKKRSFEIEKRKEKIKNKKVEENGRSSVEWQENEKLMFTSSVWNGYFPQISQTLFRSLNHHVLVACVCSESD